MFLNLCNLAQALQSLPFAVTLVDLLELGIKQAQVSAYAFRPLVPPPSAWVRPANHLISA